MLIDAIGLFLAVSLLFYCLFAGADFGAGILEAFRGTHRREEQGTIISHAIGPVWEANHVWLILAVVILFTGFPNAYSALSITFHIPLTLMLIGIVLRGCAFAFRHYDAVRDNSQHYYTTIFIVSSFLAPVMLGVVAGGTLLGASSPVEEGFYAAFIRPWANLFCFSIGVFTCVLFTFLAAVYLIGETQETEMRQIFVRRARIVNVAAQVGLVLIGWFRLQYPIIVNSRSNPLTIYTAAAPEPTLRYLLYALIVGSVLIFPALFYLLKIFKLSEADDLAKSSAGS